MAYPLGTNHLDCCVFLRILYGGRTTIGIILTGSVLIVALGIVLGLVKFPANDQTGLTEPDCGSQGEGTAARDQYGSKKGTAIGLTGQSGAGKTTILRSLMAETGRAAQDHGRRNPSGWEKLAGCSRDKDGSSTGKPLD